MKATTKLALYIGGGAVLAVAVYLFLLSPSLARISKLSEEELSTRTEIQRLEQQILAYKTAQSDLSKAVNKELLYTSVVDDKELYKPIEEMEDAIAETGSSHTLKILRSSIRPDPNGAKQVFKKVTAQTDLEEVPYTLSVQNSDYTRLVNFFRYLEHNPYYTEVSKIDLSYLEDATTGQGFAAIIQGVFLVNKDEAQ